VTWLGRDVGPECVRAVGPALAQEGGEAVCLSLSLSPSLALSLALSALAQEGGEAVCLALSLLLLLFLLLCLRHDAA
jgi:hypothetical protein